ncbi:MAG TPA: ABC transporter ATP-binding protein [Propionibacteriaceae bacterium]|nr:ABC transporter ATP-binding protein [Propionibacteriaceae bacterium]
MPGPMAHSLGGAPRVGAIFGAGGPGRPQRASRSDRAQLESVPLDLRRVLRLFTPHKLALTLVTIAIVITSVIGMAQPFLIRAIVDRAIPHQDVTLLLWCVGGMLGVTIVSQLLGVLQTWLATTVGQRVMHQLRTQLFDTVQRQSLGFFTRTRAGEVQSRLTNDVAGMQSVVTDTATSIASNVTTLIATIVAMAALSWRLTLLSAVILPPAIWLTRRVALVRREITTRQQERLAELQSQINDGLSVSGVLLSKTLGLGPQQSARFAADSRGLVDLELESQLAGRWRMAAMQIIFAAIPAAIYLVAGLPATSGGMTIGTLIAFSTLQAGIFRPLMGVLNTGAQLITAGALFSRVFEFLDLDDALPVSANPVHLDPATARGELRVEHVSYTYPGAERPAVDDLTVTVPPGGSLALVGATGSGKSTAASLLSRLMDPVEGRILLDGVDLRELDPQQLTRLVGVVTQETYLVHDTIRANLLLADPDATDADLWEALAAAQIADHIASLPGGLDTRVGERGYRFSGGEKQRIAVARTILRDPAVLILDEATSALDNETERALQAALDGLSRGRTTVTIAHRLSTIEDADEVLVLDHGRTIERGTHQSLMAAGGAYAALARRAQARQAAA